MSKLALALGVGLLLSGACSSRQAGTQPCTTPWTGTCRLKSVNKIAERETPLPYVVYEGLYEPVGAPGDVVPARPTVEGRAIYDADIRLHLQKQPEVPCEQTVDAQCFPGKTLAHIAEFTPPTDQKAPGTHGCAILEQQENPQGAAQGAEALPEVLEFENNSTNLLPDSKAALEGVAARILGDASLECVAIVSQTAPNETAGLAEQRTWAIRRSLVDRGVPAERLQTIALRPITGTNAEPLPGLPVERKARFRVLVKAPPSAQN